MLPIIFIVWYNLSIYYFIIFLLLCGLINETINLSKIFVLSIKSLIIKSLIMIMAGSVLLAKIAIINVDYFLYITWLLFILLTLYLFKKNFFSFLLLNLILLTCIISAHIFQINNNILLYLIIINSISDVSAYLVGSLIKGPKLIPKISPNKTYSGVLGSYLFSIICLFIWMEFISFGFFIHYKVFLMTIIFSTVAQIGDLTISYFKRLEKIKDTGKVLPGHGGIFDRIDGLMFVVMMAAIYHHLQL